MASDNEARIIGIMAASGSGKGVYLKDLLRQEQPQRLVIWDFKNEYQEFTGERQKAKCRNSLEDVRKAMIKAGDGPLRIRYAPRNFTDGDRGMRAEFEALCSFVQAWENCWFLVEELSNVTMPSWAPPAWRMMTTGGRHEGITIVGVSQSPALIDKTFLSNCTMIHVGQLHEHAHRRAVEKSMDIIPGELADLVQFQYIQKHRKTGEFIAGVVHVPVKGFRPPPVPPLPQKIGKKRTGEAPTATPTPTPTGAAGAGQAPNAGAKVRARKGAGGRS